MNFSKKNGNSEISNPSLLGAHVRTHSPSGDYWIMSALALIFGSVSTVLALFSLSAKSDGSVAGKVIFLIVGLAALIYWWRGARTRVEVFEDGIIYRRKKSIRAFKWTDINEVYQRSVTEDAGK